MFNRLDLTSASSTPSHRIDRRLRPSLGQSAPSLALEPRFMTAALARAAGFTGVLRATGSSATGAGVFPSPWNVADPSSTSPVLQSVENSTQAYWIDPVGVWIEEESGHVNNRLDDPGPTLVPSSPPTSDVIEARVQHTGTDVITNLTNQSQYLGLYNAGAPGQFTYADSGGAGTNFVYNASPGTTYYVSFTATFAATGARNIFTSAAIANVAAGPYNMAINVGTQPGLVITGPSGTLHADTTFGVLTTTNLGNTYTSPAYPVTLANGGPLAVNYNSTLTTTVVVAQGPSRGPIPSLGLIPPGRHENDSQFQWSMTITANGPGV